MKIVYCCALRWVNDRQDQALGETTRTLVSSSFVSVSPFLRSIKFEEVSEGLIDKRIG